MISQAHYLALAALLFCIGVTGVVLRRNALVILMSIELMLNAANLTFLTFARFQQQAAGQVIVFFVIALAAAEVTVGLAILVAIFRKQGTIDVSDLRFLRG